MEVLANAIRQRKDKMYADQEEEMKLSLFSDDLIVYKENPKEFTKGLLEIMSNYSKISGYKVDIQQSFSYVPAMNKCNLILKCNTM